MIKKLITISSLILLVSCASLIDEETKKTGKSASASGRINSSDGNSQSIFKELDE